MRAAPRGYDGLWRCLRPSFSRVAAQHTRPSTRCRCPRDRWSSVGRASRLGLLPLLVCRAYSESAADVDGGCSVGAVRHSTAAGGARHSTAAGAARHSTDAGAARHSTAAGGARHATAAGGARHATAPAAAQQQSEPAADIYSCLYHVMPPSEEELLQFTTEDIVTALVKLRHQHHQKFFANMDLHKRIVQLVRHLVIVRRLKPTPFMYECVMDAMADPQGSATGVRRLIEDIKSQNLAPTGELCEAALAALANHPDYMLRQEILDMMKEHWLPVETSAKQYVALGMLRDGQYEMALSKLSDMMDANVIVDPWVLDIFIVVLGDMGFLDEMLTLLHRRTGPQACKEHKANLLYFALDVCSQAFHHQGTAYAWEAAVQMTQLQPADGIVENVLATASRNGDTALATKALEVLARRDKVHTSHYEALCDSFVEAGDYAGMLRIGHIMQNNNISFARNSMRVWHMALRRSPDMVDEAERVLRNVERDGQTPLFMAGVMLQSIAEKKGTEAVMDLYDAMPLLCGQACDASTMQTLMMHSRTPETTRRLASDYKAMVGEGDDPSRSRQDWQAIINMLIPLAEFDLTFRFAKQALAQQIRAHEKSGTPLTMPRWAKGVVKQAAMRDDSRILPIVDELVRVGTPEIKNELHSWLSSVKLANTNTPGSARNSKNAAQDSDPAPRGELRDDKVWSNIRRVR